MIKRSELRVGNIICWNPKLANPSSTLPPLMVEVSEIHLSKIGYVSVSLDHRVEPFGDDLIQTDAVFRSLEVYEPLRITPEVLLELGFENEGKSYHKGDAIMKEKSGVLVLDGVDTSLKMNELAFVHSLQNLYFCLTGRELL